MTGYTRKDTSNNIADGNIINADDLDNEFDGVQSAFNATTGHTHDGTAAEGAPITKIGPVQDVIASASAIYPKTTNTVDLGTSSLKYKDAFLAGSASVGGALAVAGTTTLTSQPILSSLTASSAVATDASKGLVSVTNTGTGNNVLAISPTLITPALGTPTALVGTNITGTAAGLTAGNVTTNANLTGAITSTGNATLLGSFTSLQLSTALTDETGSGAAVFATSPTFITPALGTPSSGTVTNLTGTASININGTVGATTPTTGAFTTLAASGAIKTTGANLVNEASATKLSQEGIAISRISAYGNDASTQGSLQIRTVSSDGTASTIPAVFSSTGLAITGVTLSGGTANGVAYLDGSKVLTTGSALTFDGASVFAAPRVRLANANRLDWGDTGEWIVGDNGGAMLFGVDTSEQMRLTSTGLGIGTTSPAAKLHVSTGTTTNAIAGNAVAGFTSNGNAVLSFNVPDANAAGLFFGYGGNAYWAGMEKDGGAGLRFVVAGNEMRLDTSGNLGLGVVPSAWGSSTARVMALGNPSSGISQSLSSVANTLSLTTNAYFDSVDWRYISTYNAQKYTLGDGYHKWFRAPSGTAGTIVSFTEAMTLDPSGNLGINTSSPLARLDVGTGYIISGTAASTTGSKMLAGYYSNGHLSTFGTEYADGGPIIGYGVWPSTSAAASFVSSTGINVARGAYTITGSIHLWYGGAPQTVAVDGAVATSELMRLTASGNLGVGVTSPTAKLHLYESTAAATRLRILANGGQQAALQLAGNGTTFGTTSFDVFQDGGSDAYVANRANASLQFWTNSTERMRLDSSGNLLVGTTSAYRSGRLVVKAANVTQTSTTANLQVSTTDAQGANIGGSIGMGGQVGGDETPFAYISGRKENSTSGNYAGYLAFATQNASAAVAEVARIDSSGNLGIGTSSPQARLEANLAPGSNSALMNAGVVNQITVLRAPFSLSPVGTGNAGAAWGIQFQGKNDGTYGQTKSAGLYAVSEDTGAGYNRVVGLSFYTSAFDLAQAETMRLNGSGSLGLGVVPTTRLDIAMPAGAGTPRARVDQVSDNPYYELQRWSGTGSDYVGTRIRNVQGAIAFDQSNITTIGAQTFTQAMTLNAAGNLGIGVTSSSWNTLAKVVELSNTGNAVFGNGLADVRLTSNAYFDSTWKYAGSQLAGTYEITTGIHKWNIAATGTAGAAITFTQAMTLTAAGDLLLGTTTTGGVGVTVYNQAGNSNIGRIDVNKSFSGSGTGVSFRHNGTSVGAIVYDNTSTTYVTTSDQRLKENIQDAAPASALIDAIQVRQFDWKSDGSHQRYGFVAQELVAVAPEAVHAPADPDEMMAVDYSKLVPMLVKELQSLRARVAQLESKP